MSILLQGGYVTPRSTVQRARARRVLRDLERVRLAVTPGRLELYAMSRYAGEVSYALIREVVEIALDIHGTPGRLPQRRSGPAAEAVPVLTGHDVREIIRRELRADPAALSTEIIETIRAEGPLAIQVTTLPQIVSGIRRELGIARPTWGRPRRSA